MSTRNPACGTRSFSNASEMSQAVYAPEERVSRCCWETAIVGVEWWRFRRWCGRSHFDRPGHVVQRGGDRRVMLCA
jgi:hypothetical protein